MGVIPLFSKKIFRVVTSVQRTVLQKRDQVRQYKANKTEIRKVHKTINSFFTD